MQTVNPEINHRLPLMSECFFFLWPRLNFLYWYLFNIIAGNIVLSRVYSGKVILENHLISFMLPTHWPCFEFCLNLLVIERNDSTDKGLFWILKSKIKDHCITSLVLVKYILLTSIHVKSKTIQKIGQLFYACLRTSLKIEQVRIISMYIRFVLNSEALFLCR